MKVFAISDLHLSADMGKTMDMFGDKWRNHFEKISSDWNERVASEDVVLIAGDISWAMKPQEAAGDLGRICALSGKKVMIKGNHDFWHSSLSKTRAMLSNGAFFLQNESLTLGNFAFVGSRGWKQRTDSDFREDDERIYKHEVERLAMSLEKLEKGKRVIGLMHFPPFAAGRMETEFTRMFEMAGAESVVYGHIHGKALHSPDYADFILGGVEYIETSCDNLDFRLRLIAEA